MDENGEMSSEAAEAISNVSNALDEAIVTDSPQVVNHNDRQIDPTLDAFMNGEIRTLDGDIAGDEFAADAINYQVLLGKIDSLLERLKLDA